ncbi:MAG: YigZ family protein [Clostridia bacterium]|nr:YigZ family protein [Clostridia bacterium]
MAEKKAYFTLEKEGFATLVEKRSEFLAYAKPVTTEAEAMAFVEQIRKKYPDARHTVFAYLLSSGGMRYSDDGEPQGSAGMPVLDIIRKGGFTDAVITVTRYFGGILLGTGGLVRAYSGAAKLAVAEAGVVELIPYDLVRFSVDYGMYQRVLYELKNYLAAEESTDFGAEVTLTLALPTEYTRPLQERLIALTNGKVSGEVVGSRYGRRV